jgi:hypothetical protein
VIAPRTEPDHDTIAERPKVAPHNEAEVEKAKSTQDEEATEAKAKPDDDTVAEKPKVIPKVETIKKKHNPKPQGDDGEELQADCGKSTLQDDDVKENQARPGSERRYEESGDHEGLHGEEDKEKRHHDQDDDDKPKKGSDGVMRALP